VSSYDITMRAPWAGYFIDPENTPANSVIFMLLMNSQCRGSGTLQLSDLSVPLVFDPELFSHSYDRIVSVESYLDISRIVRTPAYAKDTVQTISAPKSDSEEDILAYWREHSTRVLYKHLAHVVHCEHGKAR
jgi:hypothetical protein